jgi:anti-anti-sigma factor
MNSTVKVVHPSGILDSTQASELRRQIAHLLESGAGLVLIDLQDVKFIDSSGLGGLAMAFKTVKTAGGRLCLCCVGEQPRMLFELTGMEQVFEIFSTREEFNQVVAVASEVC